MKTISVKILFLVLVFFFSLETFQAWPDTTLSIPLTSGWNLVNFPLQPDDPDIQALLKGLPYISVWKWQNNNWVVALKNVDTQAYAASKSFAILTQLSEFRKLRNSKSEYRNPKQIRIF